MHFSSIVFKEEMSRYVFNMTADVFLRVLLIGLMTGVLTWVGAVLLDYYLLSSILCDNAMAGSVCQESTTTAGYISMIVGAMVGLPFLISLRVRRVILVVIASVVMMWGLAGWHSGVDWYLSLIMSAVTYMAVYAALTWLNRLRGDRAAFVFIIIFVILARLLISL